MKNHVILAAILLMGCGGNLSDEQRKKLKEGMEKQKIVRITDSEISTQAMDLAHKVYDDMKRVDFNQQKLDSLEQIHRVHIRFLVPGESNALAVERELIEAYVNGVAVGDASQENVQKIWTDNLKKDYDSLVYSQPKLIKRADGVEELQGIWNVYIAKKDVVLDLTKQK